MNDILSVKEGIFYMDSKPIFMVSGDYPYYRDSADYWEDRLLKMKAAGVNFVSFYIPWRHHFIKIDETGNQICDFEGKIKANKNVKKFIEIVHKNEMYAIIKPGPFIHAETDYGGLPDFVNPDNNPSIKPWRNFLALEGRDIDSKNKWMFVMGDVLPSPLDPEFLRLTKEYYNLVGNEVLAGNVYPQGPIVAVQFLNEGLYSDGRIDYSYAGDYTKNTFRLYRQFLKERYSSIDEYNETHSTNYKVYENIYPLGVYNGRKQFKDLKNLLKIIDWFDFGIHYYCDWVNELKASLMKGANLKELPPYYCNFPPPGGFGQALDVWATRVNPEAFKEQCGIEYGYTNWIGAVNYKKSSYFRYSFLCGRAPGMNLEENWSFGKLYDFYYTYGFTPLYQTLLAISSRCTGFNIYTAVGTAEWDDGIDTKMEKPYPSNSPIHETGRLTNKYFLLKMCTKYLELYGQEILESKPSYRMTIGLYQPYIQLTAFAGHSRKLWKKLGFKLPPSFGMDIIGQFHATMREFKEAYDIKNLMHVSTKDLIYCRSIIFGSSKFLHRSVQEKLVEYVRNGGTLFIFGELPSLDENFAPCRILQEKLRLTSRTFKKKNMRVIRFRRGTIAVIRGNPFIQKRRIRYQIVSLIFKFLTKIELIIPKIGRIPGKALPRGEFIGFLGNKLGLDKKNSIPTKEALKAIELISRSLECDAYCRLIDIIVSDQNIDAYVFSHPKKDVQHIFIFNMQKNQNIAVSVQYQLTEISSEWNEIKTTVVGNTCQLFRIENRLLNDFIYIGVNPVSRKKAPLDVEVNGERFHTDRPSDLAYFDIGRDELIISASRRKQKQTQLTIPTGDQIKIKKFIK
jgi:beta-galactosidase